MCTVYIACLLFYMGALRIGFYIQEYPMKTNNMCAQRIGFYNQEYTMKTNQRDAQRIGFLLKNIS